MTIVGGLKVLLSLYLEVLHVPATQVESGDVMVLS